jgi:DNA-binding IclR family transcriptional regulator
MAGKKSKSGPDLIPVTLKGVDRALHVLEYIAIHPGRATDISEALNLPWATLHRTLQQLEKGGFLRKEADSNRYSIGPRMWFIGATYLASHRVIETAGQFLKDASKTSGISVQLVERSQNQAVVLYSNQSGDEITRATYGYHFPLHTGSKGQVLLAYSGEKFIDDYLDGKLEQLTPNSVTDPDILREKLAQIREQQYSITIADVQMFTGSMAAPIFDRDGKVNSCVCFVTKKSVIEDEKRRNRLVELLQETAQSISMALGWRPGVVRA